MFARRTDAKRETHPGGVGRRLSCGGRLYIATGDPVEADPRQFLATQAAAYRGSLAVLGEGVLYHRAAVDASGLTILAEELNPPRVETVYRLGLARAKEGRFDERRTHIPTYVRPPEAEEKWGRGEETSKSRKVEKSKQES